MARQPLSRLPWHLYSFSFAPNPEWTSTFSSQPEIWDYLRGCAERYGVMLGGQATTSTVRYAVEGTATSAAAGVAEGGLKPESLLGVLNGR